MLSSYYSRGTCRKHWCPWGLLASTTTSSELSWMSWFSKILLHELFSMALGLISSKPHMTDIIDPLGMGLPGNLK